MDHTVAFDIGTTAVKGVLMDEQLTVLAEESVTLVTYYEAGGRVEQEPKAWYDAFCTICRGFAAQLPAEERITAVVMSGQMQDTIGLDAEREAVGRAILYADSRAQRQAGYLQERLGSAAMTAITGNEMNASLPFAQLLWLKEEEPKRYERFAHVVFSAKDHIIAQLTGEAVTDLTTAATVGLLDITRHCWRIDWLEAVGLAPELLPRLARAEELAGRVTEQAAKQCGLPVGTAVYTGLGDAGAAALASGITSPDEITIHLGTSGWVAAISQTVRRQPTVFNLVAADTDYYLNVVPFLNAGNVRAWAAQTFAGSDHERLRDLAAASAPGAGGVFCLPYLTGERYPVLDGQVRGSFLGITPETQTADLARAALEGVAYSIRQGLDSLNVAAETIMLIGGGAQDPLWCQILADVLGKRVSVLDKSDYLPAMSLAALVQMARGKINDHPTLVKMLRQQSGSTTYHPAPDAVRSYDRFYERYLQIYPLLRAFYAAGD